MGRLCFSIVQWAVPVGNHNSVAAGISRCFDPCQMQAIAKLVDRSASWQIDACKLKSQI